MWYRTLRRNFGDRSGVPVMAFFRGRILLNDGVVVANHIEIWINACRYGTQEYWDGSFEVPVVTALSAPAYRLHLADGREGNITNIATRISGENVMVYFEGSGPLTAGT